MASRPISPPLQSISPAPMTLPPSMADPSTEPSKKALASIKPTSSSPIQAPSPLRTSIPPTSSTPTAPSPAPLAPTPIPLSDQVIFDDFFHVSPDPVIDAATNTATLNWNFDAGLTTFEFLADGETLTLNYDVTVTDGVETDLTTVAINITGSDPTITGGPVNRTSKKALASIKPTYSSPIQAPSPLRTSIPPTSSTPTAPSPAPLAPTPTRSGHLR